MARGRPPQGAGIVQRLEGSLAAKNRLQAILRTLSGEMSVPQACEELGIGESRFHELRNEILQGMLENLEGRPRGRPPSAAGADARVQELENQVQALTADLRASQIREELAIMLPRLSRRPEDSGGEKKRGTGK